MKKISVALVGVGGYGRNAARSALEYGERWGIRVVGAVEPFPEGAPELGALVNAGARHYDSLEAFYRENGADLCVISTPIQFHVEQMLLAMERGSGVLCEKPLCARAEDIPALVAARDKAGVPVGIGYQWSFSPAVMRLKQDVMAGKYGKPMYAKTLILWPRDTHYYRRGIGWAGKRVDAQGRYVMDSVAANATAHYLHNLLYVLGGAYDRSARAEAVRASLYRANDIDMYDTAVIAARVEGGARIFYAASHAVKDVRNPVQLFEFEGGRVTFDAEAGGRFIGDFADGRVVDYGAPEEPSTEQCEKLRRMAAAMRGEETVPCGIEAAAEHVRVLGAALESMPPEPFPHDLVLASGDAPLYHVKGLERLLTQCYERMDMPSEAGAPWACAGAETAAAG